MSPDSFIELDITTTREFASLGILHKDSHGAFNTYITNQAYMQSHLKR